MPLVARKMTMLRSTGFGFAIVCFLTLGGELRAYSQVPQASSYHQVIDDIARLDRAICLQAWDQAIDVTSALIASSDVSSTYRQELLLFRRQLQHLRLNPVPPTIRASCDRTQSLFLTLTESETPGPQPLDWDLALATLNNSRPIIDLDNTYDPLSDLIPAELTAESPETLIDFATPIDTTDGFNVISDRINSSPQVYSFLARRGDLLFLEADVTRTYNQGNFRLLLFDKAGQLLTRSDQSNFHTSVRSYRIPNTDVYFAAVVSEESAPILDRQGYLIEWQANGAKSFDYTLTLTGVTPYQTLLP